jgi:hypothetical protein
MKMSYGEPVAQDISEYDPRINVFSLKKTVWKDDATVIALSEVGRLLHGEEVYDLVVTMTDLALQKAAQQEEDSRQSEEAQSAGSENANN